MSFSAILTMSQYTPKERAEIVAFYIENNRSIVKIVKIEKWRFGVASSLSGFNCTWLFSLGLFKKQSLCQQAKDNWRT